MGSLLSLKEGGVPMVTYSELFQFVTMLATVAELVYIISKKR